MRRRKILGTQYRASRFFRVMGNPTAYQIISLPKKSPLTPTELAQRVRVSFMTVCDTPRNLRQANLVRYEPRNKNKVYFIKDKMLPEVLLHIEKYVDKMRVKKW